MLSGYVVVPAALAYLGVLFAVAYVGDRRADAGRSLIATPYVYALSLGVYATAWTFYGSVGLRPVRTWAWCSGGVGGAGSVGSSAGTYTACTDVIAPFAVEVMRSCNSPISVASVGW